MNDLEWAKFWKREYNRRLFFVNESTACQSTWQQPKLKHARSAATMADYTQEWQITNARTMYILLRLDALAIAQNNLFACTEVIDENLLEFYESKHSWCRRAQLGNLLLILTASGPANPTDNVVWSEKYYEIPDGFVSPTSFELNVYSEAGQMDIYACDHYSSVLDRTSS